MKRIGLLGGMSWESTVTYYQMINEAVKRRLGGLHSAELVLYSVDFAEIEKCQAEGDWERSGEILGEAAAALERAGAEMILICTNTMHKVAPQIQANIQVPLVHIAEATADELNRRGICRAALLGTKYTMTQDFYKAKLVEAGIEVLVPDEADMETVNDGRDPGGVERKISRHHPPPGKPGRGRRDPGLHGDRPAGETGRCGAAGV